jgi:AraC-like DNA-binding protein
MAGEEPLRRFAAVRTNDPDELRERMAPLYAVRTLEVPRSKIALDARVNHRELQSIGLSYARYGSTVRGTLAHGNFYAQGFGIASYGEAVVDGRLFKVCNKEGGIGGPGANARLTYQPGFEHLFMKIRPEALTRKLSALIGAPVTPPLKFTGEIDRRALEAQFRLLCFLISELDRSEDQPPALVLAELEQALIVAYLCSNLHNYSQRLNGHRPESGPWQVRRAADFIEANWNQPLTIETLALVTESSARSLFAAFRKARGCSPMRFVKKVRLEHARTMLLQPSAKTSVTSVALDCGFSNLGHFAKDYLASFGELPSETLKRGRLSQQE